MFSGLHAAWCRTGTQQCLLDSRNWTCTVTWSRPHEHERNCQRCKDTLLRILTAKALGLHYCITCCEAKPTARPASQARQGTESAASHKPHSDPCSNCHDLSIKTSWAPWQKSSRANRQKYAVFPPAPDTKGKFSRGLPQNSSDSEILLDATCPNLCLQILQRGLLFWVGLPGMQLMGKTDFIR